MTSYLNGIRQDVYLMQALEQRTMTTTPVANSIGYKIWEVEKHLHPTTGTMAYPTLTTAVTISSSASADTYGAWTEVIPASTITVKFDPHIIYVTDVSRANSIYRLQIGAGAGGAEVAIGTIVLGKASTDKSIKEFIVGCARQAANARISARVMNTTGSSDVDILLGYHEYSEAGLQ